MVCYTEKNHIAFEIDDEDYGWVSQHTWSCSNDGYITTRIGKKIIGIHRILANTPVGMETDHIDGNNKNNHKLNLRVCSTSQNLRNRNSHLGSYSKYKGVVWHKKAKKWQAQIMFDFKSMYLGIFNSEEEADRKSVV